MRVLKSNNSGGPTQAWGHPWHAAVASFRRSAQDGCIPRRQTVRNTDCRCAGFDDTCGGCCVFSTPSCNVQCYEACVSSATSVSQVCSWPHSGSCTAGMLFRFVFTVLPFSGTPQDEAEVSLEPWLRSPLLSGGVHASEDILGESAWQSLGRRSWDAAWTAEQQGRLVRTRSFMAWGGRGAGTLRTGAARDEFAAAVTEEEFLSSGGQSSSLAHSQIRLAARIVRATKIPQGLVLWPDVPCVRVTATVDDVDVSCQEEVLNIPTSGSPAASGESVDAHEEGSSETSSNDQTRPGDIVLELGLPQTQAVTDDNGQRGSLPVLSIRVEVLVGRVVTATGTVDLSDELKASLTGPNTRRTVLTLTGEGEILCVVDLNRQAVSSATLGGLPQVRTGIPATVPSVREGGEPEMNDTSLEEEPIDSCLERFLDSIARWGLEGGSNSAIGTVDSDSSPVSPLAAQTSLAGDATEQKFGGSIEENRHVKSFKQGGSSFPDLVGWLGRSHPDPTFLRLALEKTNSYAFPLVEAPFLAALLKHGGLVREAFQAAEMLSAWDEGEWMRTTKTK